MLLGAALAARAPRHGHVCVELERVAGSVAVEGAEADELVALAWPDPAAWADALAASVIVAPPDAPDDDPRPLVFANGRLYLDRMWRDERFVADELMRRAGLDADDWTIGSDHLVDEFFPPDAAAPESAPPQSGWEEPDLQRHAAISMLRRPLTVIAGGPGTGKTRALARVMALLRRRAGTPLSVALAAPTGKAAARMGEAVRNELWDAGAATQLFPDVEPTTLHRLLGLGPRRRAAIPIDADMVIVDEASMVSLPLMAQLLRALPDTTRLVLVGDPGQLASVEAGTVLADIVGEAVPDDRAGPLAGLDGEQGPVRSNRSARRRGDRVAAAVPIRRAVRHPAARRGDQDRRRGRSPPVARYRCRAAVRRARRPVHEHRRRRHPPTARRGGGDDVPARQHRTGERGVALDEGGPAAVRPPARSPRRRAMERPGRAVVGSRRRRVRCERSLVRRPTRPHHPQRPGGAPEQR